MHTSHTRTLFIHHVLNTHTLRGYALAQAHEHTHTQTHMHTTRCRAATATHTHTLTHTQQIHYHTHARHVHIHIYKSTLTGCFVIAACGCGDGVRAAMTTGGKAAGVYAAIISSSVFCKKLINVNIIAPPTHAAASFATLHISNKLVTQQIVSGACESMLHVSVCECVFEGVCMCAYHIAVAY